MEYGVQGSCFDNSINRCYMVRDVPIFCSAGSPPQPYTCWKQELRPCVTEGCDASYDQDGDGYYRDSGTCHPPNGEVDCNDDPNDGGSAIHPHATEICNDPGQRDEDCDGFANCQDSACRQSNTTCDAECDKDGDGYVSKTCEGGNDCVDDPQGPHGSVAFVIHPGVDPDTGLPYTELQVEGACSDDIDWDCDGKPKCDDPDCSQDPVCAVGGGGGGDPQPGNRYCSGSYEATDWYVYDPEYMTWSYAFTTWEYSVNCELLARPLLRDSGFSAESHRRLWRIIELNEPEWRNSLPLDRLAAQSRVVAIGEPLENVSRTSPDGYHATTNYSVRLIEVLKGNLLPGTTISVIMPGGWVTEGDGVILDARAIRVRKMVNGKRYVLFLKNSAGQGNFFTPIRGSQGLFELPGIGSRVFHLGRSFDLSPPNRGELQSVFLQQLRSVTSNQ